MIFSPLKKNLSLIPERWVSFRDTVQVLPYTMMTSRYRDDEETWRSDDIWYSKQELRQIKKDAKALACRRRKKGVMLSAFVD